MQRRLTILIALTWAILSNINPATPADKYALLVGVTKYRHDRMNDSPLKYPEADAKAVAALLQESGYTIEMLLGEKATQRAVQAALTKAGREGTSRGAVLLGFFGHGVQYGEAAYYGCYDTSVRIVKDSLDRTVRDDNGQPKLEPDPETMVPMRSILDALTACGARNRVLLADCCREDPSRARGRAFGTTLTTKDLPPRTVTLFACSANEQAFEHDDWQHGAFTYAFLQHSSALAKLGAVTSGTLSDKLVVSVRKMVHDKTDGKEMQNVYWLSSGTADLQITAGVTPPGPPEIPLRPDINRPATGRKAGDEIADNGLNMKLCWIPAGKFAMGSPESEEGRGNDESQVPVTLSRGFWLGKHEVTQKEWRLVMKTKESYVKEGDLFPATFVSWYDAREFCRKLTAQERDAGRLGSDEEYRLPTEAEWEYSCRAGTATAFSFGNDASRLSDYAWWGGGDDGNAKIEQYAHEVGSKRPNAWGLHDMHGNAHEWCQDVYVAQLPGGADPVVNDGTSIRVYRGGSWSGVPNYCRSAFRFSSTPDLQDYDLGFRVLRSSSK